MSLGNWLITVVSSTSRNTRNKKSPGGRQKRWPRNAAFAPGLERLEDRLAPAVKLTYGGPATALSLTELTAGATPAVLVSEVTQGMLKIDLGTGQTFASSSTGTATGLTYQNAGSPSTSQYATIDISAANNILAFQAALAGDIFNIGPIEDTAGGLGSITASAGVINVMGLNTAASGGNVNLTASGHLTVASNTVLYTGTGIIVLAADVNANGTGDSDTTDALAIQSGATVLSSNPSSSAIFLRGAAINIDTSSDPARVGWGSIVSTAPTATLTGLNAPAIMAFDSSGNLFVGNFGNLNGTTVSEFAPGSTTSTATLSGVDAPNGLAFDSKGDLFVTNRGGTTVSEFAPGSTTPTATLTGLVGPTGLAFDSKGDLFVANWEGGIGPNTVSEFAPGSTTPTATLTGLDGPYWLAFDSSGNLFVTNVLNNTVSEFAPGNTSPTATLTGLNYPIDLAFDSSGNLFVANTGNNYNGTTVSEFAPGSTTPTATLTGLDGPLLMAFDSRGNFFVTNKGGNTVSEFAPGSTTPMARLTGLNVPAGLAFDSSGNLFVANEGGTTVSEFANALPAGGVVIRTAQSTQTMSIGANPSGANINLTNAELAQIHTTATGAITFGDAGQTGTITFQDATLTSNVQIPTSSAPYVINGNVTMGSLTNGGNLTVGAGSTLTLTGNFTQTSAGTLNVQAGGIPSSTQFSQIVSSGGTANLNGTLNIALVNSL